MMRYEVKQSKNLGNWFIWDNELKDWVKNQFGNPRRWGRTSSGRARNAARILNGESSQRGKKRIISS